MRGDLSSLWINGDLKIERGPKTRLYTMIHFVSVLSDLGQ